MTLVMLAAKRALFTRLATLTYPSPASDPTDPVAVFPSQFMGEPTRRMVYGQQGRFVRDNQVAEWGVLTRESVDVIAVVEVFQPGDDVDSAEADAEGIAEVILADTAANPHLAGPSTWCLVAAGDVTYAATASPEPGVTVYLSLTFSFLGLSS